jgi:hypothetical protein
MGPELVYVIQAPAASTAPPLASGTVNPVHVTICDTVMPPDAPAGRAATTSEGMVNARAAALAVHVNEAKRTPSGLWTPAEPVMRTGPVPPPDHSTVKGRPDATVVWRLVQTNGSGSSMVIWNGPMSLPPEPA